MGATEKELVLQKQLAELQEQLTKREEEQRAARVALDRERLTRATNELIQTLTSPPFVEQMQRHLAQEGGLDSAAQLLSIDGLRRAGADIPNDFRLTSRQFEDRVHGVRISIESLSSVYGESCCTIGSGRLRRRVRGRLGCLWRRRMVMSVFSCDSHLQGVSIEC
jgi:hypothetical protein